MHFDAIRFLEAIKIVCKNVEICEHMWKSLKILDQYLTKINEKSCFEHVKLTLCKIIWFSRTERFWPRSGNTLAQVPKFWRFSCENCSDPSKSALWKQSKPYAKTLKFIKIVENHRSTKINENSWFEHVKLTFCKIIWFSRPERFWPRSDNTLAQVHTFWEF